MKLIIGLLVVMGIGWVVVYYAGGYSSFDPDEQGMQAKAALSPGMPWKDAFAATGDPKKWQVVRRETVRVNGEDVDVFKPGPSMPFTRDNLEKRLEENSVPHGFLCTFVYSNATAFTVEFDGLGAVAEVRDAITQADLLQTRDQ